MSVVPPANFLRQIAVREPGARGVSQDRILAAIEPLFLPTCLAHEIDTDFRLCYFAGELCVESWQFSQLEEADSGHQYEGAKRLGNTHPGDGPRFKGRGLIQLTGRANYTRFGPLASLDLINHPELAAMPANAMMLACLFWQKNGINRHADADDIDAVRHAVNGGTNGLDEAAEATDRAFKLLGYRD